MFLIWRTRAWLAGVFLASLTTTVAVADEVQPKGGKAVIGRILQETETLVVVLGEGGIRAFPRQEIASLRYGRPTPRRRSLRVAGNAPTSTSARSAILNSNRTIELVSTESVSAEDPFTRKALSDFFSTVCDPPLQIVPAGEQKVSRQRTSADDSDAQKPGGETLRIRLESTVSLGNVVHFYGIELAREVKCRLTFVMERVSESGRQLLLQGGPLSYSLMGKGDEAGTKRVATRAYRGAIATLLTALKASPDTANVLGIGVEEESPPESEKKKGKTP